MTRSLVLRPPTPGRISWLQLTDYWSSILRSLLSLDGGCSLMKNEHRSSLLITTPNGRNHVLIFLIQIFGNWLRHRVLIFGNWLRLPLKCVSKKILGVVIPNGEKANHPFTTSASYDHVRFLGAVSVKNPAKYILIWEGCRLCYEHANSKECLVKISKRHWLCLLRLCPFT